MRLEDREAIKQVKYRYMRCLDQKRWEEIASCFTEHATAAYSGGKYAYEGREAIVDFLSRSMSRRSFLSSHRVHHPEITFVGEDSATGVWALEDTVVDTQFEITIRGAAFYEDRYARVGGEWKIEHTGYARTYEEIQTRKDVPGLRLTASYWGTGGQSELAVD